MWKDTVNRMLDRVPRRYILYGGRPQPAFYVCGLAGFHAALIAVVAGGLLAGRSLAVTVALGGICAGSFFGYAHLRKQVTGRETLVLIEHVWVALAACAAALAAGGLPVLAYLDVVAAGSCLFLAGGRAGCLTAGCCHGRPSDFGITYSSGVPIQWKGVRLFPVPLVELAGLVLIGAGALAALPFTTPGTLLVWFLAAYAVLRFATEGLRGDPRPHWFRLSLPRWMCLAQFTFAVRLSEGWPVGWWDAAVASLLVGASWRLGKRKTPPELLSDCHIAEVRRAAKNTVSGQPRRTTTSAGVRVVLSSAGGMAHVSLSCPDDKQSLPRLCELAAHALPELLPRQARITSGKRGFPILHLPVPQPLNGHHTDKRRTEALALELERTVEQTPPVVDARQAWYFR